MKTASLSNSSHGGDTACDRKTLTLKALHRCRLGFQKQFTHYICYHSLKLSMTLTTEACSPINCDHFLIGPVFHWGLGCDQLIVLKNSGQNWQAVKGKSFHCFSSIVPASNYEMSIMATQRAILIQMPMKCVKLPEITVIFLYNLQY